MNDYKGLMVFAEQRGGKIHPVSYELLGKGREIADRLHMELSSVLLGDGMEEEAKELVYYGADKVFLYDHPALKEFNLLSYKHNMVRLVEEVKPDTFVLGATHLGRSLGPRIAAALTTGLTADCIGIELDEEDSLIWVRPAFTGNILAYIKTSTRPQMSTIRYKVMQKRERDPGRSGQIVTKQVELVDPVLTLINKETLRGVNITEANVIVSGGRGLKRPEDFGILQSLADVFGGVIGSSRPLVDDGWIGKEHQVGFSGNTVRPKLYIACGISGSPQHLAGMRGADTIVAINADPSAPIFRIADYGIVGDLYEVVPELTNKLERRCSK
jgi:electron transfer flavoprotein alpha subunit